MKISQEITTEWINFGNHESDSVRRKQIFTEEGNANVILESKNVRLLKTWHLPALETPFCKTQLQKLREILLK